MSVAKDIGVRLHADVGVNEIVLPDYLHQWREPGALTTAPDDENVAIAAAIENASHRLQSIVS
jgi:hypothetical protein